MTLQAFTKDPNAVLDYDFDWTAWLDSASSETISSFTITASSGLTVDSSNTINSGTGVKVWLSGGTDMTDYTVTCQITTSAARTDERSIDISVRDR